MNVEVKSILDAYNRINKKQIIKEDTNTTSTSATSSNNINENIVGNTAADWLNYIINKNKDTLSTVELLNTIIDAIGYENTKTSSLIETFISDNVQIYDDIIKYINSILTNDENNDKKYDFGVALQTYLKQNYNISIPEKYQFMPEDVKKINESDSVASKPGAYMNFTGIIKTEGVYGHVENAKFNINEFGSVIWTDGIWLDGTWAGRTSSFEGGTWKNGVWKTGSFLGGVWENGIHKGGIFAGGTWKDGIWEYGVFDGGTWENGTWKEGDWNKGAKWIIGKDSKGVEHTNPPFKWGGMKYTKVTDPSTAQINAEKKMYGKLYHTGTPGIDTFDDESNPGEVYGKIGLSKGMKSAEVNITDSVEISESVKNRLQNSKVLGKMVKYIDIKNSKK